MRSVVVWQANFARGIVVMGGNVEGLVGIEDGVDED